GDRLEHHRLAGLRRRHDEAALALADRRHQVDDPGRQDARVGLQAQPLLRVQRGQLGEVDAGLGLLRLHPVDRVETHQRVELLAPLPLAGLAHRTGDDVALAQPVLADLRQRHVHVARARQVAGGAHERVVVEDVEDARDRDEDVVLADHRLLVAVAAAAPVALAEPASAPAPAAAVIVVVLAAALVLVLAALAPAAALVAALALALPPAVAAVAPVPAVGLPVLAVLVAGLLPVAAPLGA